MRPGITQSDLLLVINKPTSRHWSARISGDGTRCEEMRGEGPIVFAQVTKGVGMNEIAEAVLRVEGERRGRLA